MTGSEHELARRQLLLMSHMEQEKLGTGKQIKNLYIFL
jgi:hypothetical protein